MNITWPNGHVIYKKGTVKIESKIKQIRQEKGLTQVEVAEKANIKQRSYQRYEAEERVPNVYTAQLIAQALQTTVEELFPLKK